MSFGLAKTAVFCHKMRADATQDDADALRKALDKRGLAIIAKEPT